ncbi:MAG: histidine kinase [Bacteroidota bacterium]
MQRLIKLLHHLPIYKKDNPPVSRPLEKHLPSYHTDQAHLLRHYILRQEGERRSIAQELHDQINSKLSALNLHLHQLMRQVPHIQAHLNPLLAILEHTIDTTYKLSNTLVPSTLDSFGLGYAVEEICDRIRETQEINVCVYIQGDAPEERDKITELNLFRILQELISNTLKFSGASEMQVSLWQTQTQFALSYQENGKGFDMEAKGFEKGYGMMDIESRLQMIQGSHTFQASPGAGVRFYVKTQLFPNYIPKP